MTLYKMTIYVHTIYICMCMSVGDLRSSMYLSLCTGISEGVDFINISIY